MSADQRDVLAALDEERRVCVRPALVRLLGLRDAVVMQQLRWHCDVHGFADVTADVIADETGLTRDQARKALTQLVNDERITFDEATDAFSRRRRYRIVESANERIAAAPESAVFFSTDVVLESVSHAPARDAVLDAFEAFWGDYPRKVAKADALKAFRAAMKLRPQPDIAAGLERWLTHWRAERTETTFIPHPATWLRGRRWEDQPVTSPPKTAGGKPPAEIITNREGRGGVLEL